MDVEKYINVITEEVVQELFGKKKDNGKFSQNKLDNIFTFLGRRDPKIKETIKQNRKKCGLLKTFFATNVCTTKFFMELNKMWFTAFKREAAVYCGSRTTPQDKQECVKRTQELLGEIKEDIVRATAKYKAAVEKQKAKVEKEKAKLKGAK